MLEFLKFISTRPLSAYLICILVLWRLLDFQQLMGNAVPQTMSRLTPPMDYFVEFVNKDEDYDRYKLMNCINYHKAVADFFPYQKAEAFGMMGFCYERLGRESQAVGAYQQAIEANHDYFWPYYDLGVIYYHQGKYVEAVDILHQAIEQIPVKTIFFLSRSKVYNDVKLSMQSGEYDYLQGLKEGRQKAYLLLMDSLLKTGSYGQLWNAALYGIREGLDEQGIFYYYAGAAAFYQRSYDRAVSFLQMALQIAPGNDNAMLYLGMCLHAAGKEEMARILMRKAALLHQNGPWLEPYLKTRVRFF